MSVCVEFRAHRTLLLVATFSIAFSPAVLAQTSDSKQAHAYRIPSGIVRVDGRLDEEFWQRAPALTDFVQAEPNEGAEPLDPMDVRFVFDESALYVGARMSSGTSGIQAPMSRRDDGDQAEYLQIELDTFLDRRTAYMFGVT